MPLFSNKFAPKKAPVRKSIISEIGRDVDSFNEKELLEKDSIIKLCLGDQQTVFENGQWIPGIITVKFKKTSTLLITYR